VFDKRERNIRKALKHLARQRLVGILQPGNIWVVEHAVPSDEATHAALLTCYLRGWAEPHENAVPTGELTPDGTLPADVSPFRHHTQMYRLTDGGWAVVNRAQMWTLTTVFVGIVSLLLSVIAILAAQ